jgi:ribosomal protein L37AE/L43A
MQRYLCPACGETTEAQLDRIVWCAGCAQPLTIADLMPVAVAIEPEESEPEASIST